MADANHVQPLRLFTPADLSDADRSAGLEESDRNALRAIAELTKTYAARPHRQIGRPGPVCPFVSPATKLDTIWLAAERSAGRSTPEIVRIIEDYKRRLLAASPVDGEAAQYRVIMVAFTDLPAAQAPDFFGPVMDLISLSSYRNEGIVMGPFYEGNEASAVNNPNFPAFTSPVPFLELRLAVVSDWKFFLNNDEWFAEWNRRYGASDAFAEEIHFPPWRSRRI